MRCVREVALPENRHHLHYPQPQQLRQEPQQQQHAQQRPQWQDLPQKQQEQSPQREQEGEICGVGMPRSKPRGRKKKTQACIAAGAEAAAPAREWQAEAPHVSATEAQARRGEIFLPLVMVGNVSECQVIAELSP